jgi:hypothetical protein
MNKSTRALVMTAVVCAIADRGSGTRADTVDRLMRSHHFPRGAKESA